MFMRLLCRNNNLLSYTYVKSLQLVVNNEARHANNSNSISDTNAKLTKFGKEKNIPKNKLIIATIV